MDLCLEGRHPVLPYAAHSNGQGLPATFLPLRLRPSAPPPSEAPPPSFSPRDLPVLVSEHRLGGVGTLCEPRFLSEGICRASRKHQSHRSKEPTALLLSGGSE